MEFLLLGTALQLAYFCVHLIVVCFHHHSDLCVQKLCYRQFQIIYFVLDFMILAAKNNINSVREGGKKRKEIIVYERTSWSFIQHKNPGIMCNPEVVFVGRFDTWISLTRPGISQVQVMWDESATNLYGSNFYVGWMRGCSYVMITSHHGNILAR